VEEDGGDQKQELKMVKELLPEVPRHKVLCEVRRCRWSASGIVRIVSRERNINTHSIDD
jgi:hypothetical protein